MAFVLEKKEDMQNIYEMAKKVYDRQISADEAAALLAKKTEAKTSSLKMYFNIYASMRKGKCYKHGTSAAFTEFLLSQIYLDFGEEVVITALSAAKLHSEYRASVNNEQPGIALACRRFIENNSIDVEYDSLPSYQEKGEPDMLLEQERKNLLEAINKPNTEFSATIMRLVEKYQIFSNEDLTLLCDQYKSRELFSLSGYSYLKHVDTRKELAPQLKSADGRKRYYSNVYILNGNSYVMTSQLYGYGGASSHRDNRKQFFDWVLSKFEISAKATFEKKSSDTYETTISTENSGEQTMTAKEQIEAVKNYIAAKGFNYDGALIENFYLSLKSKPFVILAGTSGTGKTRLVRLFAEAINAEYKLVAVRPDWSDSSDLFGHVDLNQKFIPGAVIDFVKKAELNPAKPYFLCLDEMNLARVEYYMSDILSAIETRRFDNKGLTTDPVFDSVNYGNDTAAAERYGDVVLPGNLYIIGTVNMDETTFPFSKKVLDRANTIEFSHVDLSALPAFDSEEPESFNASNNFLVSEYIKLNDCSISDRDYISSISEKLAVINDILKMADAQVGYRVRDEIVFYMLNNKKAELLDENTAFDNQIMQKILPRVHGSSSVIKTMLEELGKHCESDKYVASAEKIKFMIKRYEDDGFTSYWL